MHSIQRALAGISLGLFVTFASTCQFAIAQGTRPFTQQPKPDWIWSADRTFNNQRIYLRKELDIASPIKSAKMYTSCDNRMTLWINGKEVGHETEWSRPIVTDIKKHLVVGNNVIAVQASNEGGVAAFVFKLIVEHENGKKTTVVSDASWKMSDEKPSAKWNQVAFDSSAWQGKLRSLGKLGVQPWGVPGTGGRRSSGSVIDVADINVPSGFVVDHVYTVPRDQQGSWVALSRGPNGKLVASDQGDKGLYWIAVSETDDGPQADVARIDVNQPGSPRKLSGAQGLLWAFDALWVHRNGGHLYRVKDSSGDGTLDEVEQLPSQTGGGEHGNHALILSEDGEAINMVGGNHAPLADVQRQRVTTWNEDLLLPRMWDANGHARGRLAPGGWVTRLDPQTMKQELVSIGFRNQYDVALNRHGDMFTYDADMEWDLGAPWYRPTRICQVVSGADYGWRSGTGKWPTYYEDSLPPVVEIGPGSPTGVVAGIGAAFPAKYQEAIFALDWTFGTIYAIHLEAKGAGYTASSEPFVTGSPLPVTDAAVGSDGHLYFTVGGRGTQSALYRIRYEGDAPTETVTASLPNDVQAARALRKQLEAHHGKPLEPKEAAKAIELAWPSLSSDDRFLRAAARVVLESQPSQLWAGRAVTETDPQAKITASIALARVGGKHRQAAIIDGLMQIDADSLDNAQLLGLLRAYALAFTRMGRPVDSQSAKLLASLDAMLPHQDDDVNTELVRLLVYLESPNVVAKTMELIRNRKAPQPPDWSELASRNAGYGGTVQKVLDNHPPSREIGYALMLRTVRDGWTLEQRREYFAFLNEAAKKSGGASFPGFMRNIRDEALGNCSDAERVALQDLTGEQYDPVPDFEIKPIQGPGRTWTLAEARSQAASQFRKADFENGRSLYFATSCGKCHRFAGLGGNIGPDLTTIPRKFDVSYVIEHIIEPSKVISDQYQSKSVLTASGSTYTGLVSESEGQVVIYPSDLKSDPITLDEEDVELIRPSSLSQMPKGLIDGLNAEELRDLLAYLMSGGDRNNQKVYGKR